MAKYDNKEQPTVHLLALHAFGEELEVARLHETAKSKRPDCYISSKDIVVEVKDIVSAKGMKSGNCAGKTIEAVEARLKQVSFLGSYDVNLPYLQHWNPQDKIFQAIVSKLTDHLVGGRQEVDTQITLDLTESIFAKVNRFDSDENFVDVWCTDHFETVDPEVPEARSEIKKNIKKAITQLKAFQLNESATAKGWILLVLKNFRLAGRDHVIEETIKEMEIVEVDQIWSVSSSEGGVIGNDWKRWK